MLCRKHGDPMKTVGFKYLKYITSFDAVLVTVGPMDVVLSGDEQSLNILCTIRLPRPTPIGLVRCPTIRVPHRYVPVLCVSEHGAS